MQMCFEQQAFLFFANEQYTTDMTSLKRPLTVAVSTLE